MSLFDRRRILFLPLLLAGCGFTPVYGPAGQGNALYGQVRVFEPDNRLDYFLVQNLEQQLGRSSTPRFDLNVTTLVVDEGQAVTETGDITRYSVVGRATYVLTGIGSDAVLASGEVENFTGYSATGSTVETLAAERDAQERLMMILSQQITNRLLSLDGLAG